jgi:CO/xanthine dehydrogenase FAD-binding subunit
VIDLWPLHAPRRRGDEPEPIACALGEYADGAGTGLRLGALSTCGFLASPAVAARADVLAAAAAEVGSEQIKSRATLGGNLATASPAADLNPVLMALGAFVRLRSAGAHRDVWVEQFLCGYRETLRAPDELIECVYVPARPPRERRAFRKVGTRRAQSIAKVVVALCVEQDEARRVTALRCACGSVAERTVLLPALAKSLVGRTPEPGLIEHATREAVRDDVAPIDDVRSTAEYRRTVLQRVLVRMLGGLLEA